MALNLNQAINKIRELFTHIIGTSAFSIDILEIKDDPLRIDIYRITIHMERVGSGEEKRYIIMYNATQNNIENIKPLED